MNKAKPLFALPLLLLASCSESTGSKLNDGYMLSGWSDNAAYIAVETYAIYIASDYSKLEYYVVTYSGKRYGRDIHVRTTLGDETRTRHYYNVSFEIEFKEE